MTSEASRAPTPAVYRVSPLYDIYGQTLYPYVNHKLSGVTPYLSDNLLIQPHSREPSPPSTPSQLNKCPPLTASESMPNSVKDGGSPM
jgi:hypothetical protein